jgi:hypothetical protein
MTILLSGCALISGLDQLGTGPGGNDSGPGTDGFSFDAPTDTGSSPDGTADTGPLPDGQTPDSGSPDSGSPDSGKPDSGSPADSGPDTQPYPSGVYCGSYQQLCTGNQTCCKSNNNYTCVGGACGGLSVQCDDWKDCGGISKVCCADLFNNQVNAVSCQDQSSCVIGQQHQQLCDPGAATPCPQGKACNGAAPNGLSSNYKTCQ